MLSASARFALGAASMRSRFVLEDGVRFHAVERRGLVFDSSLVPPSPGRSTCMVLLLVLEGRIDVTAPEPAHFLAPAGLLLSEDEVEGAGGVRRFAFRASGEPYCGIDLRVLRRHVLITPPPTGLVACDDELMARARNVLVVEGEDHAMEATHALLEALVSRRMIHEELAGRAAAGRRGRFERLWRGLRPFAERYQALPTLDGISIGAGTSLRQLARDIDQLRAAIGYNTGWRATTRRLRLKLAAVALSSGASIAEVAQAVGYGSIEAMARAFRDAGMPAPSAVRAAARGTSPV